MLKPLPAHRHVLEHGHSVVDWAEQRVRIGRDARERGKSIPHVEVIGDQLGAAVEEITERKSAIRPLKLVGPDLTDTMKGLKSQRRFIEKQKQFSAEFKPPAL